MKCPYIATCEIITQTTFEYEDGIQTSTTSVETQAPNMCECLMNECAAWKNGECKYNER